MSNRGAYDSATVKFLRSVLDAQAAPIRWRLLLLWFAGNVAVSTLAWFLVSLFVK
jgi:hypothetical protein